MGQKGFTLIELMFVLSIIGILAAIAIPNFSAYQDKAKMSEGYLFFDMVKKEIVEFYAHTGRFPSDNKEAGLPEPDKIKGNHVEKITVKNGMATVKFYQKVSPVGGDIMAYMPVVAKENPTGAVFWVREYQDIEPWMNTFGNTFENENEMKSENQLVKRKKRK